MIDITSLDLGKLDWDKSADGLIPAIIQNHSTLQVLMLGYMSEESLHKTIKTGKAVFFSRSKNRLWQKGEESGNFLHVKSIDIDCDNDTILIKARPVGDTCHKGTISCFGEQDADGVGFLAKLENLIAHRYENPLPNSYTNSLFDAGIERIAQKVGEEAVESVISAVANQDNFQQEVADLLYHLIVLLKAKNTSLNDVISVLMKRE